MRERLGQGAESVVHADVMSPTALSPSTRPAAAARSSKPSTTPAPAAQRITLGKNESGTVIRYRYDGGTNFHEIWEGQLITGIIRAGGPAVGNLGGGIGSILYTDQSTHPDGGQWEGFLYNAVGHTTVVTDSAGSHTQASAYEPFGQTIYCGRKTGIALDQYSRYAILCACGKSSSRMNSRRGGTRWMSPSRNRLMRALDCSRHSGPAWDARTRTR